MFSLMQRWSSTMTPDQSGSGSNGNEGVLHTPQSSWTGAAPPVSYPGHDNEWDILPWIIAIMISCGE